MASIVERNGKYAVVITYTDDDGKRHQKWETYSTMADAKRRRAEVEYHQNLGSFSVPKCTTIEELAEEYISLYLLKNIIINSVQYLVSVFQNEITQQISQRSPNIYHSSLSSF